MNLISFLKEQIDVTKSMEEFILNSSEMIYVPKGHILMKPKAEYNKISTSVLFMEKGLARVYSVRKEKVYTMRFIPENTFSFSIERNLLNINDDYSWETIEDSQIRIFEFATLEKVLDKYKDLEKVTRNILFKTLFDYQELSFNSRALTAKERFDKLMNENPDIFLRAPLGHIASFLGITPQVLSVMRGKNKKK